MLVEDFPYWPIKDPSSLNLPGSISPYSSMLPPSDSIGLSLMSIDVLLPFIGSWSLKYKRDGVTKVALKPPFLKLHVLASTSSATWFNSNQWVALNELANLQSNHTVPGNVLLARNKYSGLIYRGVLLDTPWIKTNNCEHGKPGRRVIIFWEFLDQALNRLVGSTQP